MGCVMIVFVIVAFELLVIHTTEIPLLFSGILTFAVLIWKSQRSINNTGLMLEF